VHDIRQLSEQRIRQRDDALLVDTRNDRLSFVMTKRALGDDAHFRLPRDVEIRAREMKTFQQRMTAATLLMRRSGKRLQAFIERIVPRGDGFHRQRRR